MATGRVTLDYEVHTLCPSQRNPQSSSSSISNPNNPSVVKKLLKSSQPFRVLFKGAATLNPPSASPNTHLLTNVVWCVKFKRPPDRCGVVCKPKDPLDKCRVVCKPRHPPDQRVVVCKHLTNAVKPKHPPNKCGVAGPRGRVSGCRGRCCSTSSRRRPTPP